MRIYVVEIYIYIYIYIHTHTHTFGEREREDILLDLWPVSQGEQHLLEEKQEPSPAKTCHCPTKAR